MSSVNYRNHRIFRLGTAGRLGAALTLAAVIVLAGCGSSNSSSTQASTFPNTTPAGTLNTYIGTTPADSTAVSAQSGLWSLTLCVPSAASPCDISHPDANTFIAWDVDTRANNTDINVLEAAGRVERTGGFLELTLTDDPNISPEPAGFALAIPGRIALMRQGDSTVPVTAMAATGCQSIGSAKMFNFIMLPTNTWNQATDAAYGSVDIATKGDSWTFSNYTLTTSAGTAATNSGATLPHGVCGTTPAGDATYLNIDPSTRLPQTVAVGASGFYIADQGSYNSIANPGELGMLRPTAQLTTSDLLSKSYLGYIYEPGADASSVVPETQLAAFAPSSPAGTLIGGGYPIVCTASCLDDPTQPAANNLIIDLGAQDGTINGLYPHVSITNQQTGVSYPAVAMAGNPESKYAVFILGQDTDNNLPLGIYLLQQ